MNRKQRKRRLDRRQAHHESVGRPRSVLNRRSYSTVKQAHIVPATYQRNFAVDDQVAVHVLGRPTCVLLDVQKAGTRSRYYRRTRPDGTQIDDVEASLDVLENVSGPVLAELAAGAELTPEHKGIITQFIGMQMVRGPAFFSQHRERVMAAVRRELTAPEHVKPALLSDSGGNMQVARQRVIEMYLHTTQTLWSMTTLAMRAAGVLGSMRWQLLQFEEPAVAYSDQPVVVWSADVGVLTAPPKEPNLTPLNALEVRVPLSPRLAALMTWSDLPDIGEPQPAPVEHAAEMNALVIGQADKQWMHLPGTEPPAASGELRPLSERYERGYGVLSLGTSRRRAVAVRFLRRVRTKSYINEIDVANIT